jgi:hypothetical protein
MEKIPNFNPETREAKIRRMLGLRDFPKRTQEEKLKLLGSQQRLNVLNSITTTTLPISKKEMKKGAVLEIIEKRLLSDEILRNHPLVYIGSGIDIEYPLALGGRHIIMVDPIFVDETAISEVIERIKVACNKEAKDDDGKLSFTFDFGSSNEDVLVELSAKPYSNSNEGYVIPENTGAIVLYASQSPSGVVRVDEHMKSKLVENGIIIEDTTVTKKGDVNVVELGK